MAITDALAAQIAAPAGNGGGATTTLLKFDVLTNTAAQIIYLGLAAAAIFILFGVKRHRPGEVGVIVLVVFGALMIYRMDPTGIGDWLNTNLMPG